MPQNLKADIEYHRARIAFYQQALRETEADASIPNRLDRVKSLRKIISDMTRTLDDLEKALAQRT